MTNKKELSITTRR